MAENQGPEQEPVEEQEVPAESQSDQAPSGEEQAGERSMSDDMEMVKGETAQEKITYVSDQAQKWGQRVNASVQGIVSLINPVTGIILLVLAVVVVLAVYAASISQTLGRNSNACKNGEDCSIAEAQAVPNCGVTITLTGTDNISKVFNYLVSQGFSPEGAAGIAGNFKAEAGAVPWVAEYESQYVAAWQPGSPYVTGNYRDGRGVGGWGIGQWSFGRHEALKEWVISNVGKEYYVSQYTNGNPPLNRAQEDTLLATQLDFLIKGEPAEKGNIDAVRNATSPEDAAEKFHDLWERSVGWNPIRAQYAREIFSSAGGGGGSTPVSGGGSSCDGSGVAGEITGNLATRWEIMKSKSQMCQVPWATAAACSSWYNQCPKVVDILFGGDGPGRGYGNGKDVAQGIINAGLAQSSGHSLADVPPGAVISFDTGTTYGHVATYAGNGIIWTNDYGCPGALCEFKIADSPQLTGSGITWALPKPAFDEGGGP